VYDTAGHLSAVTNTQGVTLNLSSDASGRTLAVSGPLSVGVTYQYDALGDVTRIAEATGAARTFTYDGLGRLIQAVDAGGHATTLAYGADGSLSTSTDRLGVITTFTRDSDGRLTKKSAGSSISTFTYDSIGELVQAVNSTATLQLSYDDAGRLITQTESGPSLPATTVQHTYDAAGHLTAINGPQGVARRTYDQDGRVASIQDSFGLTQLAYDSGSRLTSFSRPNGAVDRFTYDSAGRLTNQTTAVGSSVVNAYTYGYTDMSRLASAGTGGDTATYARDAAGRLVSVQHSDPSRPSETFNYDSRNNRASWSGQPGAYTYGADDQLLSSPAGSFTYDAEGQRTSMLSSGSATSLSWTPEHQLASVRAPDGSSSTFQYDAMGRRVALTDGTTVRAFAYDGDQLVAEYQNGALAAGYTLGIKSDRPLNMNRGGRAFYYLQDQHNNVTALLDGSGAIAQTYSYSAYGVPTSGSTAVANPLTYQASPFDSRAGAYYNRARYYDPTDGVFLSQDPQPALNQYGFVGGDPIDFADPSGATIVDIAGIFRFDLSLNAFLRGCLRGVIVTALVQAFRVARGGQVDAKVFGFNLAAACVYGGFFPGYIGKTGGAFITYVSASFIMAFLFGVIVDVIDQALHCGSVRDPGQALLSGFVSGVGGAIGGGVSAGSGGSNWAVAGSIGARATARALGPPVTC
jgi:RHS repeat-associated protein